ncbi:mucin-5AC-like [Brienomyrus brachyistius]|uniref:mucin-5AC-like n=1 Tax=Brienomyrus brachyistius TaxID=42636 RepID=UPI0020B449CE|nr:mucin-5AC-like [Brienomyrus brachyistius]
MAASSTSGTTASQIPAPSTPASQPLSSVAVPQSLAASLAISQPSAPSVTPAQPLATLKTATLWPSPQSTAHHLSQASAASQPHFVTVVPVTVPPLSPTELEIGTNAQAKSTEASKFVKATSLWSLTPNVNVFMFVLSKSTHPKLMAANSNATKPPKILLSPVTHPLLAPSTISAFAKLERQNLNRTTQTESPTSWLTSARQELTLPQKLFSLTTRNLPLRQSSTAKNNPRVTHTVASLEDLNYWKDRPITFIKFLSFNESEKGFISLLKQRHNRNNGVFSYFSDSMQQSDDMSTTVEYPFKTHNGNVHTNQDPLFKDDVYNATRNMPPDSPSLEKDLTERNKLTFSETEGATNVVVKGIPRSSGSVAQGKRSQFIGTMESPISPSKDLILTPAVVLNQPKEERSKLLIDRTVTGSEPQKRLFVLPFTAVNSLGSELKNEPSEASERSSPSVQLQQSTPSPSKEDESRTLQALTMQITGC